MSSRECYSKFERKDGHYKGLLQAGDVEALGRSGSRCLSASSALSAPDGEPNLADFDAGSRRSP